MTTTQRHWCIYDNPRTRCRELWVDGKMMQWISMGLIKAGTAGGQSDGPRGAWGAPWSGGRTHGDTRAFGDGCEPPTTP